MKPLAACLLLLTLAGCVGAVNDYAKTALSFADEASNNTMTDWKQANDGEARALAAGYCGLVRIGAYYRRYQDPEIRKMRDDLCAAEAKIGFMGPGS
jgi:hypothetical protein